MSVDNGKTSRRRKPHESLIPRRPWPISTHGIPIPRRREENRWLRQILDKLVDIERRLDRIEKLLSGRSVLKRKERGAQKS